VPQLKVLQECITLIVFTLVAFALFRSPVAVELPRFLRAHRGAVYFAFNIRLMRPIQPHEQAHPSRAGRGHFLMADVHPASVRSRYYLAASCIGIARHRRGHLAAGIAGLVAQTGRRVCRSAPL